MIGMRWNRECLGMFYVYVYAYVYAGRPDDLRQLATCACVCVVCNKERL